MNYVSTPPPPRWEVSPGCADGVAVVSGSFLNFAASFQGRLAALLCCLTAAFIRPTFRAAAAGGFRRLPAFAPAAFVLLALALPQTAAANDLALSVTPSSFSENGGAKTFTVTATISSSLSQDHAGSIIVGQWPNDTAFLNTDYTAAYSQLIYVIAAGDTSATLDFELTPIKDTVSECDETITFRGSFSTTSVVYANTSITLTDDASCPDVTLSASPSSVTEDPGAKTVTVTATADAAISTARTVTVSVGGSGTATSGTDYAAVSDFDITIDANKTTGSGTFTLTSTQDTLVEGSETIGVAGTTPKATVTGTTVTLANKNPAVTLSVSPSSVGEGASATTVTVTATAAAAVSSERTVTVSVGGTGSAISGTDYAAVSDFDITISKTKTTGTGTFTLTPTQDAFVEGEEGIGVAGASPDTDVTGATVFLSDDDSAMLTVNDASADEGDNLTFTVTLGNVVHHGGLTVTPSYTNGTAASSDYTANTTALSFTGTANETKTFTVATTEDAVFESDETFTVGLDITRKPKGSSATVTSGTGTINNDDSATVTINDANADEGDSMTFTVTLDNAVQGGLTVTPSYTNGTAADTDYTKNTNALSFTGTANETKTFTVATTEDTNAEADETFTVGLGVSNAPSGVTVTSDTGTGTINNDDNYPAVTLSVNPASVGEADSATTVTVTATAASSIASARTVTVSVGGTGTATSGTDYAAVSNFDITIAANATSGTGTFSLTPTQDTTVEGNETIGVAGTSPSTTVTGATVTLSDDDSTPAVNLSLNPSSVGEGARATTVTVTAAFSNTSTYGADKTVTVSVGGSGTATSGTDYTAVSNFDITITKGTTSGTATFTLTPTQDTLVEGNETIGVAGTSTGLTVNGADLTLTDDDKHPAVTLSTSPSNVGEGAGATTVTVTATAASSIRVVPEGDRVGGRDRHRDFRHGLYGGVELRHHDRGERDNRDGEVHADADAGHDGGRQRDGWRGGDQPEHDGDGHHGDAERRRHSADREPDFEPVERGRGRQRDDGDGDGGVLQHQHVHDGQDSNHIGGRQRHGDLRHGLCGGLELRHHDYQGDYQRHGDVYIDADAGCITRR